MKLSDYKEDYYSFTGKLSDINRQIAFAGIALIWIFRKTGTENVFICHDLVLPIILLASSLGCDLLQYIYQSLTWAIFYRCKEIKVMKGKIKDDNIDASPLLNYPSWFFFILKVALGCMRLHIYNQLPDREYIGFVDVRFQIYS